MDEYCWMGGTGMELDRIALYNKHNPEKMLNHFLRKYRHHFQNWADLEDFQQELRIAIWKATKLFDPAKGKFSTIAYAKMKHCLIIHITYLNRQKRKTEKGMILSLHKKIETKDDQVELGDILPGLDCTEDTAIVNAILDSLPKKDKEFINQFQQYDTLKDMHKGLNKSHNWPIYRKKEIIQKIVGEE